MKVKDLIAELQSVDPEKSISLIANIGGNPEDELADTECWHIELWDDGLESVTIFMADRRRAV